MSDWSPDIDRLQNFDNEEWLKVEKNYCGRLMAYVSRRVADMQAREDILQETFLGSVRGIPNFDRIFTFEQYLFGICRNRTIDFLRRRKTVGVGESADSSDHLPGMENLARVDVTPSAVFHSKDIAGQGNRLLKTILEEWVQETWQQGEFKRLMVIEALFLGGWRNRDTWKRFKLRDETAVAGIKFRALKRLRELAERLDPSGQVIPALADAAAEGLGREDLDVRQVWSLGHVSCPGRHWLARYLEGSLPEDPKTFVDFHLGEMNCPWCVANMDNMRSKEASELQPFIERMHQSTMIELRSRTMRREDGDE
ncbi:MAG: DNA-directed RNA polymerase specialized sigma24 family protein [Planctomycetota bacterium]|jgi:DNA-directed RNA polymerase specialized sigma24 family protein